MPDKESQRAKISRAQILRLSQLGADKQAWDMFRVAGWDERSGPDALTLRGRLIKDGARRANAPAQQALFLAAADSYAEAARLAASTYALVNAATLAYLGGDETTARRRAEQLIKMLDSGRHNPDTDYWLAATRAEALLLLRRSEEARASFADAVSKAPEAWEDHAITLRQFVLLLERMGQDPSWLDAYRPAPCLFFSGFMRLANHDAARNAITAALDAIRPGIGYGALAAGADILIAEALLARGAGLHIVLPCDPELFREASVRAAGADWANRFDNLLAGADVLEVIANPPQLTRAAIELADGVAMGLALSRARILSTRAVRLSILPHGESERELDRRWSIAGGATVVVECQSSANVSVPATDEGQPPSALLAIRGGPPVGETFSTLGLVSSNNTGISCYQFDRWEDALHAALALPEGVAVGVDFNVVASPGDLEELTAFALAAAEAAPRGAFYASKAAGMCAQLSGLTACLVGEIRTAYGVEEVYALLKENSSDDEVTQSGG